MRNPFSRRRKRRRSRGPGRGARGALSPDTKRGIAIVVIFTVALFSLLSFAEATGSVGFFITDLLAQIFGKGDWAVPILLLALSYFLLRPQNYTMRLINYVGLALVIIGLTGLLHLSVRDLPLADIIDQGRGGGYIGYAVGNLLYQLTAFGGSFIILLALLLIGAFVFFNVSFGTLAGLWRFIVERIAKIQVRRALKRDLSTPDEDDEATVGDEENEDEDADDEEAGPEESNDDAEDGHEGDEDPSEPRQPKKRRSYPAISIPADLLTPSTEKPASGDIKLGMKKIEATLASFGIQVTMGDVNVGPTVTQYTLKPHEGVKLNQITTLSSDLSLALAAHPIRIEAPIPGKSLVGIEVPNQAVSTVKLRDVLDSNAYTGRSNNLMLALGKDVTGKVMMADLHKMPHLLIAGATGSGKSVAINSMIISLLYQNSPELMKLILVDPKRVELTTYDGIPHLVAPVITDIEKTINALKWTVAQMDERYKLLSAAGHKNIASYNSSRALEKMPYIIVIIDELADLMMVAAKDVESAIIRLSQMARAVGIHLILATQRPSVNVITGLIKANITSRIAFAVASLTDSRTIIDSSGAEKLLGSGDMLYMSAELSKPKRIQGALVSDGEIQAVTNYLKERGEPDYESAVTERPGSTGGANGGYESLEEERDIRTATEVVVRAKRASATLLQSRMRVGFAKASRLLDALEERGIIGQQQSSKPREVLITQEELDAERETRLGASEPADDFETGDDEEDGEETDDEAADVGESDKESDADDETEEDDGRRE